MDLPSKDESKIKKTQNESFRQLMVDFMNYTTSHGLGRLVAATTNVGKAFWVIACLATFAMFFYQVIKLFQIYLSRPVETFVTINFHIKELNFPAVTICNLNMIKKDEVPNELIDIFPSNSSDGVENHPKLKNLTRNKKLDSRLHDHSELVEGAEGEDEWTAISEEYPDVSEANKDAKLRRNIDLLLGDLPPEELYPTGHLFEDLVKKCAWKGFDCKEGNFSKYWTRSWNYKYGNCYTFNNGVDQENNPMRVLKATKPGPSQGLVLKLDIEQDQYIGSLTEEAGLRVTLHDQGVKAFPYEEGFSVSPGMATSVALTKALIKRLDRFSNKSCLADPTLDKENIYKKYDNITRYSQQNIEGKSRKYFSLHLCRRGNHTYYLPTAKACRKSCLGISQKQTCGCSESEFPSRNRPCDTFDEQERKCLQLVKYLYNRDKLTCIKKCRRLCREELYLKTISSSQWPSKAHERYLSTPSDYDNMTSQNTLVLNIFYSQLNYESVEEKFSYELTKLLADIGGQLGLWIGISALTSCEMLELMLMFATLAIKKLKTRNHVTEINQMR